MTVAGLAFDTMTAPATGFDDPVYTWHVVGMFLAFACGAAMIWRRSHPVVVLVVCAVGAIAFPLDPIGPALALTWVISRASTRTLAWTVPLAVVAVVVSLGRDVLRPNELAVMVVDNVETGGKDRLTVPGYVVVGLVIIGMALAVGYLRRRAVAAERVANASGRAAAALHQELSRQEERELIAREMHDTVAHHLSVLSLHASALEVTAADPAVPDTARMMRASAHQALEEMRGLITSLRDSSDDGYGGAPPDLTDLARLVADARAAGVRIASRIEVPQDVVAPQALTRAVYRIVQESLTNALKHAPGSGVSLHVVGGPGAGLTVMVVSWLLRHGGVRDAAVPGAGNGAYGGNGVHTASGMLAGTGSSAGLIGMSERATALGGTMTAGPEGPLWVVRAWLPWASS